MNQGGGPTLVQSDTPLRNQGGVTTLVQSDALGMYDALLGW